jgi:hypothetical protein
VIAWTPQNDGWKFSVRSSGCKVKARDLALWLTAGKGGGHKEKAGGWLKRAEVLKNDKSPLDYFLRQVTRYLDAYTIIDCAKPDETIGQDMAKYRKNEVTIGYVPSVPLFSEGTRLQLRMLEGDAIITASEEIILMVGTLGEAYFMKKRLFDEKYLPLSEPYFLASRLEYSPTVSAIMSCEIIRLLDKALQCRSLPSSPVLAKKLEHPVKVFPEWDRYNYLLGEQGDWLVRQEDKPSDMYIVKKELFDSLYSPCPEKDMTGADLAALPDVRHAVKKNLAVRVTFAEGAGFVKTLEGDVAYGPGDALLTGVRGEVWPVERKSFLRAYASVPPLRMGEKGLYTKRPVSVHVLQLQEPGLVRGRHGVLRGNRGDWLIQYGADDYGIVAEAIFAETYDVA